MRIGSFIILLLIGTIICSCNGKKTIKNYYDNGKISEITSYKGDKLEGEYKAYYENEKIRAEGTYQNGIMNGEWKYWYEDGRLMSRGVYKDGKIIELEAWDKNSNQTITNCSGAATLTYPDGSPSSMVSYKDCEMDGRWVIWYENGQMASEIFYKNGIPTGEWKFWNKDGTIQKVEKY